MSKAQLQLPQEVVKAVKEAALITGKAPEELIGEAIREYIYSQYKLTELEKYTLADVIKVTSALAQLLSTTASIVELLKGAGAGAAAQPEQVQQPPSAPPEEERREEEEWKIELVRSIQELKEEIEALKARREAVEARPTAAAVPEEFRDIQMLITNYAKNLIKDFLLKQMAKKTA